MDYYSSIAEGYEKLHKSEQLRKIAIVKKHLKAKSPLLDIGCGTGISTNCWGKNIECVGIDPSPGLLKKMKCKKFLAKAEKLPFKNSTFNTVVSFTALHHCDIEKAVKEIKRVSKKNASYAFTILKRTKNFKKVVSVLKRNFGQFIEIDDIHDLILIKN